MKTKSTILASVGLLISVLPFFVVPNKALAGCGFLDVTCAPGKWDEPIHTWKSQTNHLLKQNIKVVRTRQFKAASQYSQPTLKIYPKIDYCKDALQSFLNRQSLVLGVESGTDTFEAHLMSSGSMLPTLKINDHILVCKRAYRSSLPQRGDIVIFNPTKTLQRQNYKEKFVSRVIGLPGERIEVKGGKVYINNHPLKEKYIEEAPHYNFGPIVVPTKSYFVLGDNRNNSYDSHYWGSVPQDLITGKVLAIFAPREHRRVFVDSSKSLKTFLSSVLTPCP